MTIGDVIKANPDPGVFPFWGGSWGMLLILLAIIVLAAFMPRFW